MRRARRVKQTPRCGVCSQSGEASYACKPEGRGTSREPLGENSSNRAEGFSLILLRNVRAMILLLGGASAIYRLHMINHAFYFLKSHFHLHTSLSCQWLLKKIKAKRIIVWLDSRWRMRRDSLRHPPCGRTTLALRRPRCAYHAGAV